MTKEANLIIVGGTIAAGKSTLVENISKATGWEAVPELRENDRIQDLVLEKLYEGTRLHQATVQYYFISNRYKQYKDVHNKLVTSILDRGLWEDWFFAKLLMKDNQKEYAYYVKLWETTLAKIVELYGKPKAYIFTTVDWDTFEKRIFGRGREAEIKNFNANKEYFKNLLDEYNDNFIVLLNKRGINPIVIDTVNMNQEQVTEYAMKKLKEQGLV
ncbi:MAG: deoxynucleoside kinase [Mycoplasmataceae bacterium]|nr:deoxynucleoside kinase [Mycoplasmataceae bacterium]